MQKLKKASLYHDGLLAVSGKMVERYNKCLQKLGFSKTKLKSFSIDGLGWSPEIAEEQNNVYYLNHGDANPHGIIISPLQKGKPIYVPYHTFDKQMIKYIFKTYEEKINNITRDSAICLDFDQNIDAFYNPLDVLKYNAVQINFRLTDNLDKAKEEQLTLIKTFKEGNNFIDEDLHKKLLQSAKKYGDLRHRSLTLEPLQFKTNSFYTKALGGIYLLRDFISTIIVYEDEDTYKDAIKDTTHDVLIYHISQPELVEKLKDHLIIACDLEKVSKTKRYQRIKKFIFSQHLNKTEHPIKDILNDHILFKRYLNKMDFKQLKDVNGVEMYLERLERSNAYKIHDMIEDSFYFALHEPHSSLLVEHQDLVWRLLVNISPKDVLFLYWYDKAQFYKRYQSWEASFQDWVIETIRNNI